MSWQEQVLEVVEAMLVDAETLGVESSHLGVAVKGYARELKAIVTAYGEKMRSVHEGPDGVMILGKTPWDGSGAAYAKANPVIEQAKKRAKDDADFAAAEMRRQELGGEVLTQLQGGPDDGTFVASPPTNVPVGAKTNFGTHVYQVTEQRGLVYVGEMER